jgi:hypothetical protein
MNALIAVAKRLSIVLNATAQGSGLWDFLPATAKNAQERERALLPSAAGQALFQHRHNQTDPVPARADGRPNGGVADSLDEARRRFRATWEPAG